MRTVHDRASTSLRGFYDGIMRCALSEYTKSPALSGTKEQTGSVGNAKIFRVSIRTIGRLVARMKA